MVLINIIRSDIKNMIGLIKSPIQNVIALQSSLSRLQKAENFVKNYAQLIKKLQSR